MDEETGRFAAGIPVVRWEGGLRTRAQDEVAIEEPLEIRVRGRSISVTMRTPGLPMHDEELAAGFLLTEGVIRAAADIQRMEHCARNEWGNVLNVQLAPLVHVDFDRLTRHVFAASSCGVCGKASVEAVMGRGGAVQSDVQVRAAVLGAMPGTMRAKQETFSRTGGLHAAALFDSDGNLLVIREDVGRHNAVDRVVGWALLRGMTGLDRFVLVVSGRTSFEIVQKAAAAGTAVVAGVSAPSSLAVELAKEMGITLIGFLREGRMNVYAGEERVVEG